jgi:uncharacterized membrane protein YphA (DoxX/SURF4 family)
MMFLAYLGRVLVAVPLLLFGVGHFMKAVPMSNMVPSYMPVSQSFWIYLTGVALILAALSYLTGVFTKLAAFLLAIMVLCFAFMVHLPGVQAEGMDSASFASLLKDLMIAGGAIYVGTKA